jgi:hypothetical protein
MNTHQKITADLSQIPCPFGTRPHAERVETGSLEINGDWPGVFIRGDNALYFSFMLSRAIEELEKQQEFDVIMLHTLKDLASTLGSCQV